MQVQVRPGKRDFVAGHAELTEAAVILSASVIACAITLHVGGLQQLYSLSRGDAAFTFGDFNTVVLFFGIALAAFGIRRIASQRDERHRRIVAERYAHSLALRDPLTRLFNRRCFEHELSTLLARHAKQGVTVLLIDLRGFQTVNELFGHTGGDACLVQAAARLREQVGGQGCLARFGDDQFTLCLAGANADTATRLALGIIEALKEPFIIGAETRTIGVKIGIAQTNLEQLIFVEILRRAHVALCRALSTNTKCCFFEEEMDSHIRKRSVLEHELKVAIRKNEIKLFYQPIVDLASGRIVAFEALARWTHAENGPIPPGLFVPLAEDLGLIDDAASWPEHVSLSFNFSPTQLKDKTLAGRTLAIMRHAGLAPHRLDAEVTEGSLVEDLPTARQVLESLRAAGVRIVMDDFGTGFSSLYHLREMRFDKLKIDRSFVQNLDADSEGDVLVRAIVGMSQGLGLTVTAEGIETVEQAGAISKMGAQQGQGFLFSRAVPIGEARHLLQAPLAFAA
jgi:diguanylate cyclase (GGDEF)-like protein